MRKIKFRAWTGIEMIPAGAIAFVDHIALTEKFDFDSMKAAIQLLDQRTSELMQYTGLKDKNGKEIYEDDVMSDPEDNERLYHVMWNGAEYRWGAWSNGRERAFADMRNGEVIGNIYENPELLTK